jgi:non-ribosomal peptide synthetase component E (peptide arylation enzyme)
VLRGYVDSSLDAAAFDDDGYFRTGDLGRQDADGYIVITGRLKDIIIRKGENISARAVEEELLRHPSVADVAVIGLPDLELGEMACAVIVVCTGHRTPTLKDLVVFLGERGVPPRQWPQRLEVLDTLPKNPTGKTIKADLRRRYGARPSP